MNQSKIMNMNSWFYNFHLLQERFEAIEMFEEISSPKFPVYADHMNNNTSRAYGGIPERIYAIRDGKIVYQGAPGPAVFDIDNFEDWLKNYSEVY